MIHAKLNEEFEVLPNGRLADIRIWTPEIAEEMAHRENLELTDEHWSIIYLMRDFYYRYNISPIVKLLKKTIARQISTDCANDEYLDRLFPNNVMIQGTRIAGLPLPLLDAEVDRPVTQVDSVAKLVKNASTETEVQHFTSEFEFQGRSIKVHRSGNLLDPSDWNEQMAVELAKKEGINLTEEHWEVIRYLRAYYFKFGITPMVRLLIDSIRESAGDEKASKEHLYQLLPGGPARQGSRIAGLPSPQGCID